MQLQQIIWRSTDTFLPCPSADYMLPFTFSSSSSSSAWWMPSRLPPNHSIFSPDVKERPAGISVGCSSHDGWNHHKVQSLFFTPALLTLWIESVKWKWVLLFCPRDMRNEALMWMISLRRWNAIKSAEKLERWWREGAKEESENNTEHQNRFQREKRGRQASLLCARQTLFRARRIRISW